MFLQPITFGYNQYAKCYVLTAVAPKSDGSHALLSLTISRQGGADTCRLELADDGDNFNILDDADYAAAVAEVRAHAYDYLPPDADALDYDAAADKAAEQFAADNKTGDWLDAMGYSYRQQAAALRQRWDALNCLVDFAATY